MKIQRDMERLRARLRERYGLYVDTQLIQVSLQAKLESKTLEEIDAVISSYSSEDLVAALDVNAQIALAEAQASRGQVEKL